MLLSAPFTGKEFRLYVTPHTDQVKLGFVQHLSGFNDHVIRTKEYRQWLNVRLSPTQEIHSIGGGTSYAPGVVIKPRGSQMHCYT
ncbi:hypothetical protein [Vulcanisaeta souniana]|uniref:hypothetical protein n=1 Tax=Vulcanisaeta souniana TaxID=164452 RepID=UPI001FB2629F|nr:hypothetical protein [Vulcanisaeta souniana]